MRAPHRHNTWDEYLIVEETSGVKHEFFDGCIYAMSGGTVEHAQLAASVIIALGTQLRGTGCRVFSSDLRVRVEASGLGTYPDAAVICGEIRYDDAVKRTSALNPRVLFEVLSDSTEAYDRGTKFAHYRSIPSLQEYVLVSHREQLIEVFRRPESGGEEWVRTEARRGRRVMLGSVEAALDVDELYAGVQLG